MAGQKVPGARELADGSWAISLELDRGFLDSSVLRVLSELTQEGVKVHPTTAQKILLLDIPKDKVEAYLDRLEEAGALIRKGGSSFQPRVCIGKPYCRLALGETFSLGQAIYYRFRGYALPHKFKVAIAGCSACCSWANIVDLGFVAVKSGYKVTVGGKGGFHPRPGKVLGQVSSKEEALLFMEAVLEFFHRFGKPQKRLATVIEEVGFAPLLEILKGVPLKVCNQNV